MTAEEVIREGLPKWLHFKLVRYNVSLIRPDDRHFVVYISISQENHSVRRKYVTVMLSVPLSFGLSGRLVFHSDTVILAIQVIQFFSFCCQYIKREATFLSHENPIRTIHCTFSVPRAYGIEMGMVRMKLGTKLTPAGVFKLLTLGGWRYLLWPVGCIPAHRVGKDVPKHHFSAWLQLAVALIVFTQQNNFVYENTLKQKAPIRLSKVIGKSTQVDRSILPLTCGRFCLKFLGTSTARWGFI